MRRTTTFFALTMLLLAGCSEKRRNEPQNKFSYSGPETQQVTSVDIREDVPRPSYRNAAPPPPLVVSPPEGMAAPGIAVTAAPGVAFNYRYAFVLPDTAISAIQEQHATACEKLSPQHCRIVGMHYTLVDEDEVRGQLQFKLDPTLARNFGKEGIAAVEHAKGRLVDAAIEGNDVGAAINESQRRSVQITAELNRIERQLADKALSRTELDELRAQAARLRSQQAREVDTRDQGEEMLANTPMTFNYAGKKGLSWGDDAIGDAWDSSQSSFATMISIILVGLGILLPWAGLLALLIFIWRKTPLRRLRFRHWSAPKSEIDAPEGPSPASPPVP